MYGELAEGSRPVGRPRLRYKDIRKRDMKLSGIDVNKWESYADDRAKWRTTVRDDESGVMRAEERRRAEQEDKRRRRKQRLRERLPLQNWPTEPLLKMPKDIMCYPSSHETEGCQPQYSIV